MKTTQLRDGTTVLAHGSAVYGISAYTYANRTQAEKAAQRVGGEVIKRGRPWYVRVSVPGATLSQCSANPECGARVDMEE